MRTKVYNRLEYSEKTLMTFIAGMRLDIVTRAQLEGLIEGVINKKVNEIRKEYESQQRLPQGAA